MRILKLKNFNDSAGTNRSAAFADSETELFFNSNGFDEFYGDFYVIAGHNHFYAGRKFDRTGNVGSSDEELRTIVVEERSVTAAFVCFKNVNLSGELGSSFNGTGFSKNLTLFDTLSVDTAEKCAYVEACDSFVNALVEHFKTGNNGSNGFFDKTNDFSGVAYVSGTSFYSAGCNGTTTGNREYVFYGKEEGFSRVSFGGGDVAIDSIHKL